MPAILAILNTRYYPNAISALRERTDHYPMNRLNPASLLWILFATFRLNLFLVLLVFICIVIAVIRRLGSGEWNGYEQEGEQEGLYNEGMPSHHIYLPVCKCACVIVLQMIYLIPVASVSTDTPTLIHCRLLLDTLSRLYIVPYRVELLSPAQSLG